MNRKISTEGWAAIYELVQSVTPRKSIALEFGISYTHLRQTIRKLEREGLPHDQRQEKH